MHDGVIARTRQNVSIFDLWPQFLTLTFKVGARVFIPTRCINVVNICTKLFHIALKHVGVTDRTRQNGPIFYLWPQFRTLTFEVGARVFIATPRLNVVNIRTKLFQIALKCVGVTDRTSFVTDGLTNRQTDRQTDWLTDRRTDSAITICPPWRGHKNSNARVMDLVHVTSYHQV